MKRSLSVTLDILGKLGACLAACIGCTKQSPRPTKPAGIHWHSPSGYEDTTADKPDPAMP